MYCIQCSHALIKQIPEHDNVLRDVCPNCSYIHYQNPKIIVGVIPTYHQKIMLCRRAIEPAYDKWTVPGGFLECGESV